MAMRPTRMAHGRLYGRPVRLASTRQCHVCTTVRLVRTPPPPKKHPTSCSVCRIPDCRKMQPPQGGGGGASLRLKAVLCVGGGGGSVTQTFRYHKNDPRNLSARKLRFFVTR